MGKNLRYLDPGDHVFYVCTLDNKITIGVYTIIDYWDEIHRSRRDVNDNVCYSALDSNNILPLFSAYMPFVQNDLYIRENWYFTSNFKKFEEELKRVTNKSFIEWASEQTTDITPFTDAYYKYNNEII